MTTYTHPFTFCWIVCELLEKKGWKIRRGGSMATNSMRLPDGMTSTGDNVYESFVALCEAFVKAHKIPIAFDRAAFKETVGEAKDLGEDDPDRDPVPPPFGGSPFEDLFGKRGFGSTFNWGHSDWEWAENEPKGHFRPASRDTELWKQIYREKYAGKPAATASEREAREQEVDRIYANLTTHGADPQSGFKHYKMPNF